MWQVKLLGRFVVRARNGTEVLFPTRKSRELFAWLVLHENTRHERLRVARDLWPGVSDSEARRLVRDHLHRANQSLKVAQNPAALIQSDKQHVWLLPDDVSLDTDQFKISPEPGLIEGVPLEGEDWSWLTEIQTLLRSETLASCLQASELAAEDDAELALEWMNAAARCAPLNKQIRERQGALANQRLTGHAIAMQKLSRKSQRLGRIQQDWRASLSSLAILACFGAVWTTFFRMGNQSSLSLPQCQERLAELRPRIRAHPSDRVLLLERSQICARLSDLAWEAMWTSEEPRFIAAFKNDAKDFNDSLEWSLSSEPSLALHIIGNGHRVLELSRGDDRWKDWLRQALLASPKSKSIERARALCGIAYAHWSDDKQLGFESAEEAAGIFHDLGARLDEANAWRHMGICAPLWNPVDSELYLRALNRYSHMGDQRGMAMTELSLAERGWPSKSFLGDFRLDLAYWAMRSAERFSKIGCERLEDEALEHLFKAAPYIKSKRSLDIFRSYLPVARARVAQLSSENQRVAADALDLYCLTYDLPCCDDRGFVQDLDSLLSPNSSVHHNPYYHAMLLGALCKRAKAAKPHESSGESADSIAPSMKNNSTLRAAFLRGQNATQQEILLAASKLEVPPVSF